MPNECTTVLFNVQYAASRVLEIESSYACKSRNYFNIRLYQSRETIWLAIEQVRILYTYLQSPLIWLKIRKQK